MFIDKEELNSKLNEVEKKLCTHALPVWEEIPDIDLYMDQVISLLNKYLTIYYETLNSSKEIKPTMINNYVKLKIIPAPKKKKYSKNHLAFLIMVFILKQTLDMATIQKIIPTTTSDKDLKKIYNSFVLNQHKSYLYVTEKISSVANQVMNENKPERLNDLLLQVASSANIFKIVTEQISDLVK